jgi:adenosylhomocysteine nucleosidase
MNPLAPVLVCFAVREEASPFRKRAPLPQPMRITVTGMGRRKAEQAVRAAIAGSKPAWVLTCGFAGGLRPELTTGTVLFSTEVPELSSCLRAAGARPGRFYCFERVAATAGEKHALWTTVAADAVEMESEAICVVCREFGIPCATVRVILDAANDDLPLDFNQVLNADQQVDPLKLAATILKQPWKIPALRRFQKQAQLAANSLADVLQAVLSTRMAANPEEGRKP